MINRQINQYLNHCRTIRQMSVTTIKNKRDILYRFLRVTEIKNIEDLDDEKLNFYIKKLSSKTKISSLNTYLSTIISFVKFQQNSGVQINLNFNNLPRFKNTKTTRKFYTKSEIAKVLKHVKEPENLMVKIMFETGMRISELANLKIENLENNKISFVGKGGKPREVYLKTETAENLKYYLKNHKIENGYAWCIVDNVKTLDGRPPTVATIRKNLQKVFKRAGFDDFYPHALRHSFATNLQKNGASVPEIKEMMGHSSIATTERYLHGFDGQLEALFKKYQ